MRRLLLLFHIVEFSLISILPVFSQELDFTGVGRAELDEEAAAAEPELGEGFEVSIAISNKDYPVTPGDIYNLSYITAGELISQQIIVESDYILNLNIFGRVNARNRTFSSIKPEVERKVESAYPRSMPSLTISSVGRFQVLLRGAVPQTRRVTAWGLSRLSDIVRGRLADYSSIRRVGLYSNNRYRTYDLFKALYQGEEGEDPLISPGDIVEINRVQKIVEISGAVNRPGRYQLLPGDDMSELKEYVQGFSPDANLKRIRIDRIVESEATTLYYDISGSRYVSLKNGDKIYIPTITDNLPVVYLEGGIDLNITVDPSSIAEGVGEIPELYNRVSYPFREGESLYDILSTVRDRISTLVDLKSGYVYQAGKRRDVDMESLLYRRDFSEDIDLKPFDRIILPLNPFVFVSGDVTNPGRYPYSPFHTPGFYINLAGGFSFDPEREYKLTFYDEDRNRKELEEFVSPGDTINVQALENLVLVKGTVANPGQYTYRKGESHSYYIRQAGGAEGNLDPKEGITILNQYGNEKSIYARIQPGDTISVQARDNFITVNGPVNNPGQYNYRQGKPAFYYISQAGGVDTATHTGNDFILFDENGKEKESDAEIEPGDTIQVPGEDFIVITGEVNDPGRYAFNSLGSTSFYINLAGGFTFDKGKEYELIYYDQDGREKEPDEDIKPGDTIHVNSLDYYVSVSGPVSNPGEYEYRGGEPAFYYISKAGGIGGNLDADIEYVILNRFGGEKPSGTSIKPGDIIAVEPLDNFVTVNGPVLNPGQYDFREGKQAYYYIRQAGGVDTTLNADSSFVLLDESGQEKEPGAEILAGDTIQLLQDENYVVVTGGVNAPGRHLLALNEGPYYYIQLAGGFDRERNNDGSYVIFDQEGVEKEEDARIEAGDTIHVHSNNFVYNFNRYFPIVTAGMTFITTVISIITALSQ